MLKAAIVVLMIALLASLGSGLYYLMIDQGNRHKRRLHTSLTVRLSLALALAALLVYGVSSGQVGHRNPWDAGPIASEPANE